MKLSTLALTASLAAMALPASANAATYLITYTGTVSSGYDTDGLFGAANTSLAGQAFTTVYTLTDPMPGAVGFNNGTASRTYGGTNYGSSVPSPLSGKITINGFTQAIAGASLGMVEQYNEYGSLDEDAVGHQVRDISINGVSSEYSNIFNYVSSTKNNIVNSSNYTDPLNYTLQSNDSYAGFFDFYNRVYGSDGIQFTDHYRATGNLRPTSVTIAAVSAVPEPAAWAMMIAGFGLVGGVARRRKAQTAITYA